MYQEELSIVRQKKEIAKEELALYKKRLSVINQKLDELKKKTPTVSPRIPKVVTVHTVDSIKKKFTTQSPSPRYSPHSEKQPAKKLLKGGLISYINGNILDAEEKYIVQQCNCSGKKPAGLSQQINAKFGVNPYKRKQNDEPGTYKIFESGDKNIVCLFAQYKPGGSSLNDTKPDRIKWFEESLEEFIKKTSGTIAMPYNIGCGLAGGDWDSYIKIIKNLAQLYKRNITIYQYDPNALPKSP